MKKTLLTKRKRGGGYLGNRGFAVSGILYPILILTLFLIVQILTMMASRKAVLDKNKQQLLDSVNTSNKIYNNEELSILIGELQQKVDKLQGDNQSLVNKNHELLEQLETQTTQLSIVQALSTQNRFQTGYMETDLNSITEQSRSVVAFSPSTLNKPSACSYGVVVNYVFGSAPAAGATSTSYWRFQMAFCTVSTSMYIRQAINMGSWTAWTAK